MKYLLACLLVTQFTLAQQWPKTQMNEIFAMKFPSPPEKTIDNGDLYFMAQDSIGAYLAMVRNFGDIVITEDQYPKFFEGFVQGALNSSNGTLINKRLIDWDGAKGLEMHYTANISNEAPNFRYKRVLLVGNEMLSYEYWTYESTKEMAAPLMNKFFNSVAITAPKQPVLNESPMGDTAAEAGYAFGTLMAYGSMLFLVVGGLWLIFRKKK